MPVPRLWLEPTTTVTTLSPTARTHRNLPNSYPEEYYRPLSRKSQLKWCTPRETADGSKRRRVKKMIFQIRGERK
jgi:hypothetical protein